MGLYGEGDVVDCPGVSLVSDQMAARQEYPHRQRLHVNPEASKDYFCMKKCANDYLTVTPYFFHFL